MRLGAFSIIGAVVAALAAGQQCVYQDCASCVGDGGCQFCKNDADDAGQCMASGTACPSGTAKVDQCSTKTCASCGAGNVFKIVFDSKNVQAECVPKAKCQEAPSPRAAVRCYGDGGARQCGTLAPQYLTEGVHEYTAADVCFTLGCRDCTVQQSVKKCLYLANRYAHGCVNHDFFTAEEIKAGDMITVTSCPKRSGAEDIAKTLLAATVALSAAFAL